MTQQPLTTVLRLAKFACWALLFLTLLASGRTAWAAPEAEWIWKPDVAKEEIAKKAECYFRRVFTMKAPEAAVVTIAADDAYELYINGKKVGSGTGTKKLLEYDVSPLLGVGQNVVAVKVVNQAGNTAALCARVLVKDKGANWVSYSTNKQWKTSPTSAALWNTTAFTDRNWQNAQVFGKLGETVPWDLAAEESEPEQLQKGDRFTIDSEFEVQRVMEGEHTGSIIAMTFNEFGQVVISREGGTLALLVDENGDKIPETVRPYCDEIKNCHGLLCLNGEAYVTGDGPDGAALYRLTDKNRDGTMETVKTLVKFTGEHGEHGAHAVALGPDGLLYVMLGNHTAPQGKIDESGPYKHPYEGDIIQPRYEDPGGHALGIKAPGGMVIRTDTEGTAVQIVAGGIRNAYDLAFNREGEMFTADSDMEPDEGSPWYRPTRLYQIVAGGEYGWRSGWANWPDYFVDVVPPLLNNGRGSPTGLVCYNHFMFPQKYQGALFMADWSAGQIVAFKMKPNGGSYQVESSVFLSGNPLNVTDLEVGPDGALYFTTGGRGTEGGLYRVRWKGNVSESVMNIGEGITAIIRQPQLQSAFARQNIALWRKEQGAKWERNLVGVASSSANPPEYRLQALDILQLYGPAPKEDFLLFLSKESNEKVRAKAAEIMGQRPTDATRKRLLAMLADNDRQVRRKVCEALLRSGTKASYELLEKCLASDDRYEAWAARRVLEQLPAAEWKEKVLKTKNQRLLIEGSLALAVAQPDRETALSVVQALADSMGGFVSDRDFVDMLRVMQVTIERNELKPSDIPGLSLVLREEFPAGNSNINRELIRLLVFLQDASILDRYLAYLKSDASETDRAHVGLHLRYLKEGWSPTQRLALLEYFEKAQQAKAGNGFTRYVINVTRDFATQLTEEEGRLVLEHGADWPNAALGALYKLPVQLDDQLRQTLIELDGSLDDANESSQRLRIGIVAVLARSGDEQSLQYLRDGWQAEPERRQAIAMGLSMQNSEENWPYLVRTLPILDANGAGMVLKRLAEAEQAPDEPDPYRQIILLGYRLKDKGATEAIQVLEHWTGETRAEGQSWEKQLDSWRDWYALEFPQALAAELPAELPQAKWKYEELLELAGKPDSVAGDSGRGALVFAKAQCARCHRCNDQGSPLGPDLTTVAKRFTRKEILESIYYPSHVVSDQFASKAVTTTDGRVIVGLVTPGPGDDWIVLQSDGAKITIRKRDVEEMEPNKISAMPTGLLDALTKEEVVDLMAYLLKPVPLGLAERPTTPARK